MDKKNWKKDRKIGSVSDNKWYYHGTVYSHYTVSGIKYTGNIIKRWYRCPSRRNLSAAKKIHMEKLYHRSSEG